MTTKIRKNSRPRRRGDLTPRTLARKRPAHVLAIPTPAPVPAPTTKPKREVTTDRDIEELLRLAGAGRDEIDHVARLVKSALGTRTAFIADLLVGQTAELPAFAHNGTGSDKLFMAIGLMQELQPEGGLQALLAVQMAGVHAASLEFIRRSCIPEQTTDAVDSCVRRASSLQRLFLQQIEAMQRLKGKSGQQRVVVEHVSIQAGGSAIVGAVTALGPNRGEGG